MARYVEDLAIVTKMISGPDGQDPNAVGMPLKGDTDLRGLRVAYFVEDGLSQPTEEIQQMVRRCAQTLADAGAKVTQARPKRFADAIELWVFGMVPELGVALRQWLEEYATMAGAKVSDKRLALSDELFEVLDFWSKEGRYSEQRRFSVGRRIQQYRSEMHSFMQDFDVIVCPVMNGPADPYSEPEKNKPQNLEDEYNKLLGSGYSYCMAFNITGWPAASVPVGPFPHLSGRWYTEAPSKTDRPMSLQESLRALPPDQKLAIVTELWDDLAASAPLTLPEDELAEMSRRRDELLANPEIAIDADEVWRRVDGD
jgi:putative addiction module component (TIGR02574 family)